MLYIVTKSHTCRRVQRGLLCGTLPCCTYLLVIKTTTFFLSFLSNKTETDEQKKLINVSKAKTHCTFISEGN